MSWIIFFMLFAVSLAAMYLIIRRQLLAPGPVAALGTLASIISLILLSLARENSLLQAVVVGIVVGALFSGATLAGAWYFYSNEMRNKAGREGLRDELRAHEAAGQAVTSGAESILDEDY